MFLKSLLYIFFLFLCFTTFGQDDTTLLEEEKSEKQSSIIGVIGLPEMNVLYRNYKNKIQFACNYSPDSVIIKAEGASIDLIDNHTAIVYPGKSRVCSLNLCILSKSDTICLGQFAYRVSNLPAPSFYFGCLSLGQDTLFVGDEAFLSMDRFFAKYPPEIPLSADFTVSKWRVKVNNKIYEGTGAKLTDELKKAIYSTKKNSVITFLSFTYSGMGIEETIYIGTKFIKKSKSKVPYIDQNQSINSCTG